MYSVDWQYFTLEDYLKIPANYLGWLIRPYILSKAIKRVCKHFSVQLISQEFGFLNNDEIEALGAEQFELGLVRQTILKGDGVPFVYARVVIPRKTYISNKEMLRIIGENPIGESFLYNNPKMSRSIFQFKLLKSHHQLFKNAKQGLPDNTDEEFWARRSIFFLQHDPMIINEVFYNTIPRFIEEDNENYLIHHNT